MNPKIAPAPADPADTTPARPTRREFLVAASATASGFALVAHAAEQQGHGGGPTPPPPPPAPVAAVVANPWAVHLRIGTDGSVGIASPQAEIGQGVQDGLTRILAEELDADWSRVTLVQPHANPLFASPVNKRQRIGGSDSIMSHRDVMRGVGAAAREMLVSAAATRWGVPAASCRTENGRVLHDASGRSLGYGELAADAARLPVPDKPRLKTPAEYRLVGKRMTRKDTPLKVDGSAVFAVDVRAPDMVYAALRRSTSVAGRLKRFDGKGVLGRPGVIAVVPLADAVGVVADSWWRAKQAAEALDVEFDDSGLRSLTSDGIAATLRRALGDDANAKEMPRVDFSSMPPKREFADRAAVEAALARKDVKHLDVTYELPYLAHMTMEPQSCVARVAADRCDVWAGLQQPDYAKNLAAQLTGLPADSVHVNVTYGGGGFGRRWELDSLEQAVRIAMAVPGRTVKLIWTREQDLQHDFYRPAYVARYRAAVAKDGSVAALHGRLAGQSIMAYKRMTPPPMFAGMADGGSVYGLIFDEYALPLRRVDFVEVGLPVPVGFWRSVGASQNCFLCESMIDELAHAGGQDPYQFRRTLLAGHARTLAVLDLAAQKAGWDRPAGRGRGRGIAINSGFGGVCAQVVEVSVQGSRVHVDRVVCAYDCGPVIDPGVVEAQIQGGIAYGLSSAISGETTFAAGGVAQQTNFHEQPMLALPGMPKVEVHLTQISPRIGGVGEAGVPPAAPALANAIFAATGRRVRRLPLAKQGFEFAG